MRMHDGLNFFDSLQKTASPDELIALARSCHHDMQDFDEGDLENRIWKFRSYELRELPVASLHAPWTLHDDLAQEYAEQLRNGETPPPIIYDLSDDVAIDGTHRIEAAKLAGKETISAYVGVRENIDPDWCELDGDGDED